MSDADLVIEASVAPAEQRALIASAKQLAKALRTASPTAPRVHLHFCKSLEEIGGRGAVHVAVVSLLPELSASSEEWSVTRARWQKRADSLMRVTPAPVVCTIFRHVGKLGALPNAALLERLRRLNRLAIELSEQFGVGVADVDRALAHVGARNAHGSFQIESAVSAEIAAHAIVSAIIASDLDSIIAPELLPIVQRHHGRLWDPVLRKRVGRAARRG